MASEELQEINKKLDRILWYVEDDNKTGRKGMYHRLFVNEKDIEKIKSDKRFVFGVAAGISFLVSILSLVFSYLFNK